MDWMNVWRAGAIAGLLGAACSAGAAGQRPAPLPDAASQNMQTIVNLAVLPIEAQWQERDHGGLEASFKSLCGASERFSDGQPKIMIYESALNHYFGAWNAWDAYPRQLQEWRTQYPDSLAQALAETMYWSAYAWKARGGGYAHRVPQEAWQLFHERMAMASARLEESKALSNSCPLWHSLRIANLMETGAPRAVIEAAYKQAVAAFPFDLQIHAQMARVYSPRWGGSAREFDAFARRAAAITRSAEGQGMYARLYWGEDCNCDSAPPFASDGTGPEWKVMKAGFEDLLKRYPNSTWNANKFASFACRANDKETYLKLRTALQGAVYEALWPASYSMDVCDRRFGKPA
ncbi:hypothetical protein ASD15_08175 [Massilia sp. Root351]|jgi:hypothetical protein|uniref:DUF4034 domain-containing protein n=1 Tax=Massilia sp. Root351 TaxID=1736522 RepID=UPI00070A97DE|nr:DUF4034 domain-containing protein [Massilia sp. Root351]KQV85088.1 hypothetical protein ASD15_08175 [Massilia sp. Root351]